MELLGPRHDERLLDLGSGTGAVLRLLARRAERPREAIGVDASGAMLDHVGPLPVGWSTRVADARGLPFPAGRFDVAIASYLLHVLADADVPLALAELSRVLGPGGRLVTVTPAIPASGAARSLARTLDAIAERRPARAGGLRALDPRPALAQAGFALIAARWSLRGYPSLCVLASKPCYRPSLCSARPRSPGARAATGEESRKGPPARTAAVA